MVVVGGKIAGLPGLKLIEIFIVSIYVGHIKPLTIVLSVNI